MLHLKEVHVYTKPKSLAVYLQSITERKLKQASLTLSVKPGLPASIENLNGKWIQVTGTLMRSSRQSSLLSILSRRWLL